MSRPLRRARRLAAALVVVVGAAGCVSLPDSSSVHTGRAAGVREGQGQIRNAPPGPQLGDTRESIIQGYLLAMMAYPSDPAVVREFMTPTAAENWQPGHGTQVYSDPVVHSSPRVEQLSGTRLGTLDERGSWTTATGEAAKLAVDITMKQVAGQWRIDTPVPGTLINTAQFNLYYHQFSLYFYDPKYTLLAPDPVYLDTTASSETATSLVRNLLQGPTLDMEGVVRSAAPSGTRLMSPVTVSSSGLATVSLSANVASLDDQGRTSLARQLSWTLRQELVGVSELTIRVHGRPMLVPGRGTIVAVKAFPDTTLTPGSRTLYALSGEGHLVRVSATDGASEPVLGPVAQQEKAARSVAIDPSNTSGALVARDGASVVWGPLAPGSKDQEAGTFHRVGTNLLKPSWDPFGLLWLVDVVDGRASLSVANGRSIANGQPIPFRVSASGIEGLDVRAFAVSRDGMRLAAVIGRGAESRLVVGMISRPSSVDKQTPVSVVGLRSIQNSEIYLAHQHPEPDLGERHDRRGPGRAGQQCGSALPAADRRIPRGADPRLPERPASAQHRGRSQLEGAAGDRHQKRYLRAYVGPFVDTSGRRGAHLAGLPQLTRPRLSPVHRLRPKHPQAVPEAGLASRGWRRVAGCPNPEHWRPLPSTCSSAASASGAPDPVPSWLPGLACR